LGGGRRRPMTTRDEVINAAGCPACGAERGEPCRGVERRDGSRRPRKSAHAERWDAAGADRGREARSRRRREAAAKLGRERGLL
jgi:hypothetical protein